MMPKNSTIFDSWNFFVNKFFQTTELSSSMSRQKPRTALTLTWLVSTTMTYRNLLVHWRLNFNATLMVLNSSRNGTPTTFWSRNSPPRTTLSRVLNWPWTPHTLQLVGKLFIHRSYGLFLRGLWTKKCLFKFHFFNSIKDKIGFSMSYKPNKYLNLTFKSVYSLRWD